MNVAVTRVPTAHASRYLQQLCKHWSHKFPVEFTPENGRIEMSAGVLILDADAEGLGMSHVEVAAGIREHVEDELLRRALADAGPVQVELVPDRQPSRLNGVRVVDLAVCGLRHCSSLARSRTKKKPPCITRAPR